MSGDHRNQLGGQVVATLRAQEADVRQAGIRRLSLSARRPGDAEAESDVDLAIEFDPAAGMDLIRLAALERRIGETLGRPVQILPSRSKIRVCGLTSSETA